MISMGECVTVVCPKSVNVTAKMCESESECEPRCDDCVSPPSTQTE